MTDRKTWAGICVGVGLGLVAVAISQWPPARAGVPCTLPFNLQNGQPADATQVMGNYNALVACLAQAAAAGANSDITSLSALTTPITPAQGGSVVFVGGTTTGSANAQVLSGTTPTFIPTDGFIATFTAGFTNTSVVTLQIGATPAAAVLRKTVFGLSTTLGGELITGQTYGVRYRSAGPNYEILTMEQQIPGEIRDFGGGAVPPGWFIADGSCRSRTTFGLLFSIIGTAYDPGGACDINSFALPDARGRVLAAADGGTGRLSLCPFGTAGCGAQTRTLVSGNIPSTSVSFPSAIITMTFPSSTISPAIAVNAGGNTVTVAGRNTPNVGSVPNFMTTDGTSAAIDQTFALTSSFNNNLLSASFDQSVLSATVGTASPAAVVTVQPTLVVNKIIKF